MESALLWATTVGGARTRQNNRHIGRPSKMTVPTMSSLRWRAQLGGGLVAIALITVGCSDSEDTASSASSSSPTPAPTTIVTPPPPAWIRDRSCGVAWGPDGILDIVALTPGVDCGAAKRAADTYMSDVDGFMSSNPLEVGDGWTCQIPHLPLGSRCITCPNGIDRPHADHCSHTAEAL
ncbi:hypothetical protein GCM10027169_01080 [Gordonia jinhuaensis]|uniref:Uncharacterized protein n=2 Tax=Gordonia TaxID=2053 RepID=A0A916X0C2_9ACTN|nr:hypothetical protein GOSPT_139_00010 [Gordonia sputi NBRC 100414]GGB47983.1 hypothetical protein GCM10011489_38950 [Gordonia jinhuaensis]